MRSSQKRNMLARGTKAVLPKQWFAGCAKHTFVLSQEITSCEIKASGMMRSSQRRSLLARGTKAVLPKQWPAGDVKHTFVISQESINS